MASYLVVKDNNETKSYKCKSTYNSVPYLKVDTGFLDLTTETTTGLQLKVKINNSTYRPVCSQTTTSSRSSEYTETTGYSGVYDTTFEDVLTTTTGVDNYTQYLTRTSLESYIAKTSSVLMSYEGACGRFVTSQESSFLNIGRYNGKSTTILFSETITKDILTHIGNLTWYTKIPPSSSATGPKVTITFTTYMGNRSLTVYESFNPDAAAGAFLTISKGINNFSFPPQRLTYQGHCFRTHPTTATYWEGYNSYTDSILTSSLTTNEQWYSTTALTQTSSRSSQYETTIED